MGNLFKAFFYKIRKDITFRITLFIGLGFSILIPLLLFIIDLAIHAMSEGGEFVHTLCNGQTLLIMSFSPTQNFGLAIPINLITFTVLEFTNGTIRNKIISGYSKTKIFFGLYFTGLIYTLMLISGYVLISFGLGCAFGGFNLKNSVMILSALSGGQLTGEFLWKFILLAFLGYAVIASMTIFFATLFRHIGPAIPVVIILVVLCSGMASIYTVVELLGGGEGSEGVSQFMKFLAQFMRAVNPIHSILVFDSTTDPNTYETFMKIKWDSFFIELANNLVYIALFCGFGWLLFAKRDVK